MDRWIGRLIDWWIEDWWIDRKRDRKIRQIDKKITEGKKKKLLRGAIGSK